MSTEHVGRFLSLSIGGETLFSSRLWVICTGFFLTLFILQVVFNWGMRAGERQGAAQQTATYEPAPLSLQERRDIAFLSDKLREAYRRQQGDPEAENWGDGINDNRETIH